MSLKELFKDKIIRLALLPKTNDYLLTEEGKRQRQLMGMEKVEELHKKIDENLSKYLNLNALDKLDAYVPTLIKHDYTGKTPSMWNALYGKLGLNLRSMMVVANPKDLQLILDTFRKDPKYIGGGAGVGLKEEVIPFLDAIEPPDIKSVNIIVKQDGRLVGYNTDAKGLLKSLEEKLNLVGKKVKGQKFVVVGARAVAQQFTRVLAENGAEYIVIANRTLEIAENLANELNKKYGKISEAVGENHVKEAVVAHKPAAIINTSDKGSSRYPNLSMFFGEDPNNENISREIIRAIHKQCPDLIYGDIVVVEKSISLRLLEEEGVDPKFIFDDKPMVIYQAVPAYKLVEQAHKEVHRKIVSDDEALEVFREAVSK
jgi:shikimate 5-dehydrogenase